MTLYPIPSLYELMCSSVQVFLEQFIGQSKAFYKSVAEAPPLQVELDIVVSKLYELLTKN